MTTCTIQYLIDKTKPPKIYLHGDGFVLNEKESGPSILLTQLKYFTNAFVEARGFFDAEYMTARAIQYLATQRDHEFKTSKMEVTGIGVFNANDNIDVDYKIFITTEKIYATDRNDTIIKMSELPLKP